jgi:hypothetical protein
MSEKKEDNTGSPIANWNDLSPLTRESLTRFANMDLSKFGIPQPPPSDTSVLDALENGKIGELTTLCSQRDTAVNSLRATLDANYQANPLADRAPFYYAISQRYQEFLNQIAALAVSAQDLQSRGRPHLSQMLDAQKADAQNALNQVQGILGANTAARNGMNQIAQDTNKQIVDSMLRINQGWKNTFNGGS